MIFVEFFVEQERRLGRTLNERVVGNSHVEEWKGMRRVEVEMTKLEMDVVFVGIICVELGS